MNKRKTLVLCRNSLVALSAICLLISLVFLFNFIAIEKKQKPTINTPTEVSSKVLFISSYNPLYFSHESIVSGLKKGLYPNGVEFNIVYMYSNERGEASIDLFYDAIKAKLQTSKKYDAVLLGGDAALLFAIKYQKELFGRTPLVFFGVNNKELAREAAEDTYITGIFAGNYLEETVAMATKLFPERKTLVALHDQSFPGKNDINSFMGLKELYKNYSFIDLDTTLFNQNDLIFLIESLPKDSILFYMTCYSDKNGNIYSMLSRTATIVNYAKVPIFRNYVGGEDMGIVGGVHNDMERQGELVGFLVCQIIKGKGISEIPLRYYDVSRTVADYQLMKKYGRSFSLLPDGTYLYNEPETFLKHYGKILPLSIMLIMTLVFVILSSRIGFLLSKKIIEELQASRKRLVESEKELRYKAEYDETLDILNRRTIITWMYKNLKNSDEYSVIIIDIDDFKMLNENYGNSLADSILQYIVASIKSMSVENGWKLARYGGDEFLLVIPNELITMDSKSIEMLFSVLRKPIPLGDETLSLTASLGASCSDGVTPPDMHIVNAEGALFEAKIRGKNGLVIYDEKMKQKALEDIRIKELLQQAFENDGFFMLYQPQIDVQTKLVSGYEALVRMKAPGVYPGQFIPVAERSGWIWKIGRITTELVIKQLAAWRDEGKTLKPVSVNFSSNQLNDHGYVDFVEGLLKKYDIPPQYLEIEITEGLFLEKSVLADDIFRRFKNLGIRLLMDDFGTGYSSLGYLTYIPVDVIKLDKTLVDTYLVEGKDSFIRNIIHLMHDLDKDMIIEGVEEEKQFNRLREFGADTIQGYYFSKPIPADEAIDFKVS